MRGRERAITQPHKSPHKLQTTLANRLYVFTHTNKVCGYIQGSMYIGIDIGERAGPLGKQSLNLISTEGVGRGGKTREGGEDEGRGGEGTLVLVPLAKLKFC